MTRPLPLISVTLSGLVWVCSTFGPYLFFYTRAGAEEASVGQDPIDNLTVTSSTWHLGGGLLYGEATIDNRNSYSVKQVIIMCDLFDEWGNNIGSKSTALIRPFPPGETRISGIEFPTRVPNMQAGACRPLSAASLSSAEDGQ
jgi:hypothetical protein